MSRHRQKRPGGIRQAKDTQIVFVNFGSLAILLRTNMQPKTHGFASPVFTGFAFVGFLQGNTTIRVQKISLQFTVKTEACSACHPEHSEGSPDALSPRAQSIGDSSPSAQ